MLDIGGSELLVVAVVALLVVGPKELPALLRTIGRAIAAVKRQAQEFREQFDEAIRDSEFADLKNSVDDLKSEATSGLRDLGQELGKEIEKEVDDVKTVGGDLSREIEDSTKQDHDLDWLEEYERSTDAAAKPTPDAASPGSASTDPASSDADPSAPPEPTRTPEPEPVADGTETKQAGAADDGREPPKKAAGAAP